jgi:predicted CxxxxCH...CXXCH cytochrome family protein
MLTKMNCNQVQNMRRTRNILISVLSFIAIVFSFGQTTDTYDLSGTWTAPVGVTSVEVACWGAGGNGGSGAKNHSGGGGGGGAYSYTATIAVTPGNTYTVNVGVGGAATLTDRDSWFIDNTTILAKGGTDGANAGGGGSGAGGNGGQAVQGIGTSRYSGGDGAAGISGTLTGGGGGSSAGTSSNGVSAADGTGATAPAGGGNGGNGGTAANGNSGSAPGGGAGGAGDKNNNGGTGASGRVTITYTASDNQCPSSTSIAPGAAQVHCQDDPATQLTATISTSGSDGTPTLQYQWYYNITNSNDPATATAVATTQTYTPPTSASEAGNRWYFCVGYATDNGCAQSSTDQSLASGTVQVTVNTPPATPGAISGPASVTASTPGYVYSISTVAGATSYNWTLPAGDWTQTAGGTSESITVTSGLEGENGNVSVTASNSCGTSTASTLAVTVSGAPSPPTITLGANPSICQGVTSADLSYSSTSGSPDQYSVDYDVTAEGQGFVDVTNAALPGSPITLTVPGGAAGGTYNANLSVRNSGNGLSSINYPITITLTTAPDAPVISGNASVAPSMSGFVYTVPAVPGATDYTWTWPAGWTYESGQGTTTLTVTSGSVGQDGNITATVTDACGTSLPGTFAVTVVDLVDHSTISCGSCHVFHHATGSALTNNATNAGLCLSCHNPAPGSMAEDLPFLDSDKAVPGVSGNSHSWNVRATNAVYETNIPTDVEMAKRALNDTIVCSTCHDQHNSNTRPSYLRADNTGDALCKDCHSPRDRGTFAIDNVNNRGTHPVGITYNGASSKLENSPTNINILTPGGNVECSSCHSTHYANTSDGNLLNVTNDDNMCTSCHIHEGQHQAMGCNTCHDPHNPDKTNIYLISSTITTPNSGNRSVNFSSLSGTNSYADGDATYNGICEVCHTTTTVHRNDGSGAAHNPGSDCISCHLHEENFNLNCATCHNTVQGARPQIIGAGGEFDNTSRHASTTSPANNECLNCHYTSNHSSGTVELKNVDDQSLWVGNRNDWCISCHDATPPASITFPGGDPKYNKSNFIGNAHETGIGNDACSQCHEPHGAANANLIATSGNYNFCYTCHSSAGMATVAFEPADKAIPGTSGNSHAWDANATNTTYGAAPPTDASMLAKLEGGNIVCSTCHDPHDNTNPKNLMVDNSADGLCKDCHGVRDVGSYYADNANIGSHPVGVTYPTADPTRFEAVPTNAALITPGGNVECSSCHSVHNSTTSDGYLLNATNDNTLCSSCHNYPNHNGADCLVCHEPHSDGTNTNLVMIRNSVVTTSSGTRPVVFTALTGPNSGADGDNTYDGICEVCHTSNTYDYHYNDNSGDHTHNAEGRCVSCHTHETGFGAPETSCIVCHETSQGARPQITGIGGEFDQSSIHTAAAPTDTDCALCHHSNNHSQGTIVLNNPDDNTVWSGTMNAYCITCHDGTPPTGVTFPGSDPKYDKSNLASTRHETVAGDNSCVQCHNDHGSPNANLLLIAGNYAHCNSCHTAGQSAASMPIDAVNIAVPGTSGNNHAWDVNPVNATYETVTPTDATMAARLDGGNIVCSTCHDAHDNTNSPMLVINNTSNQMCKDCHSPRNLGTYATDNTNNRGSHPVGIAYPSSGDYTLPNPTTLPLVGGNVECSSCHGVHNTATNDGNLLKMTNDNNLCKDCHAYGQHQGMDCLNCHYAHESGSNNILLIKSTITTPNSGDKTVVFTSRTGTNSGADGDATYDGVCEVCHTQPEASNHLNNQPPDPADNNHYSGDDCTSCHPHSSNFTPAGGGCDGCHQTNFPNFKTNDAHFAHTVKYGYYGCDECHLNYGFGGSLEPSHPSGGAANVNFNPSGVGSSYGSSPSYAGSGGTCDNVYCHSNGVAAQRGMGDGWDWTGGTPITGDPMTYQTTPAWSSPLNTINTCFSCHPGQGNMTGDYIIERPGTIASEFDYPQTGQHIKGAHYSNTQELKWVPDKNTDWEWVQCFWCHSVGADSGPIDPLATGVNYQGTYGYSNNKLHVDGQTWFNPSNVINGGTFVDEIAGRSADGGHCGSGVSCWE